MTICCKLSLVIGFWFAVCLALQENPDQLYSINCKIKKPFTNILVTPVIEQPSEVTGCYSSNKATVDQEIHVLSLINPGTDAEEAKNGYLPSVTVEVKSRSYDRHYPNSTVIILHSYTPVMWQINLHSVENSTNFHVIVNKPSFVVPSIVTVVTRRKFPSNKRLPLWIKSQYGVVTSYSLINLANEMSLFIGVGASSAGQECNFSSKTHSRNVKASFVQLQLATGCSVGGSVAERNRIIYVIEMDSKLPNSDVLVHLRQHVSSNSVLNIIEQNVVLVLKSHEPVEWIVESTGIRGSLLIVAEYPVHVRTNVHLVTPKIQKQNLPSSSLALLSVVKNFIGSIDTYIKTSKANRINIVVQGKTKYFDGHIISKNLSHSVNEPIKNKSILTTEKSKATPHPLFADFLKNNISIICTGNNVNITFPTEETMKIFASAVGPDTKLLSITLADTDCRVNQNNTHMFLQSKMHECGSKIVLGGDLEYHNQLQFITTKEELENVSVKEHKQLPTDDDDYINEYGSGSDAHLSTLSKAEESVIYPLPFHCVKSTSADDNQIVSSEMYELNLHTSKTYASPLPASSFPLDVVVHQHLFAEANIKADLRLCIVIDECWLSESMNHLRALGKRIVLIKQGCPTDLSVDILTKSHCSARSQDADHYKMRFSFQLSEELMEQNLYLHCRLASCAMQDSQELRTNQCINDENFCLKQSLRPYLDTLFGKKYKMVVKGPFRVIPKHKIEQKKDILSFVNPESSSSPENFVDYSFEKLTGNTKKVKNQPVSQELVFVGLSTEAVVGIAFASFIIGAGLMAALWLIHMYTEPNRRFKQSREQPHKHQPNNASSNSNCIESAENFISSPAKPASVQVCS